MRTYADACGHIGGVEAMHHALLPTYADVCQRMLTHADVCERIGVVDAMHHALLPLLYQRPDSGAYFTCFTRFTLLALLLPLMYQRGRFRCVLYLLYS